MSAWVLMSYVKCSMVVSPSPKLVFQINHSVLVYHSYYLNQVYAVWLNMAQIIFSCHPFGFRYDRNNIWS